MVVVVVVGRSRVSLRVPVSRSQGSITVASSTEVSSPLYPMPSSYLRSLLSLLPLLTWPKLLEMSFSHALGGAVARLLSSSSPRDPHVSSTFFNLLRETKRC